MTLHICTPKTHKSCYLRKVTEIEVGNNYIHMYIMGVGWVYLDNITAPFKCITLPSDTMSVMGDTLRPKKESAKFFANKIKQLLQLTKDV